MHKLILLCLMAYKAYGAAHEQSEQNTFYIFNITRDSSFYLRLREEKYPHVALEATEADIKTMLPDIYKLAHSAYFEILHSLKSSKLKLRIWPKDAILDPTVLQPEMQAFAGKVIPPGDNILMIGYALEDHQDRIKQLLITKGYPVRSKCIPVQTRTPSKDYLRVYRTNAPDAALFIKDLSEVLKIDSLFYCAGELRKPVEEAEILAAVFGECLKDIF